MAGVIDIFELGKQKRKRIKQLKRRTGQLYAQVVGAAGGRDVLVIVVRDKGRKHKLPTATAPVTPMNAIGQAIQQSGEAAANAVRAGAALLAGAPANQA
jgi:hypothetical protein